MDAVVLEFEKALLSLDRLKVKDILSREYSLGDFMSILENIVVPAMENIGYKWETADVALSQVYMSGKICEEIVDKLIPQTNTTRIKNPNMAIVVYKDYHMLGKRIALTFLRASGYDVLDYGQASSIEELIEKIKNDKIEILLISVLMLNSALNVKEFILKLKKEKLKTKIVIGGAPFRFDTDLHKEIGVDAVSTNASDILGIIKTLKEQL